MQKKILKEVADIKFCTVTPSRSKSGQNITKWLACGNFLADNEINCNIVSNNVVPDREWLLQNDDIVIKRISPSFVNYVENIDEEIYCANNLIIVSPGSEVDAKYLAMILNERISDLSQKSSIGAVMKSIGRADIESVIVPLPAIEKQVGLGKIWFDSIELKKKRMRLAELERVKTNYYLKKHIDSLGGKENG